MYLNSNTHATSRGRNPARIFTACLLLWLIWLAASIASATDFQMPPNVAASGNEGGKSKKSLVSKGTFKLLKDVQKSIDHSLYDEAFEKLNKLIVRVQDNPYEAAVVLKTAAYLYVTRNEQRKAIKLMEHALNMKQLARENQQKLRYDLAQLVLAENDHAKSASLLEEWLQFAEQDEVSPAVYVRLGNAYLQGENYAEASNKLERAIELSETVNEYYYQLLLASYVAQDKIKPAISLLKKMMALFPKEKKYAMQLVGLYDQIGQDQLSLQVLELAYQRKQLDQTDEYSSLAYRLLDAGYPLKSADILKKGMDAFIVWHTPENLNLMAQAYINSQQYSLAISVLEKAIRTAKNPNTALILSQLYLEQQNYESAIDALQSALETANEKQTIAISLQLANTHFLNENEKNAKLIYERLLDKSTLSEKQRKMAENWQRYLSRQT